MVGQTGFTLENKMRGNRKKYYGKYRGIVTNVKDPEERGRIKAEVPSLLGKDYETRWALPHVPFAGEKYGFEFLPKTGEGVWIEFEGGSIKKPIWTGFWWQKEKMGRHAQAGREDDEEYNPNKRYIWLPGGSYVEIDTFEGEEEDELEEEIRFVHQNSGTETKIDKDGNKQSLLEGSLSALLKKNILLETGAGDFIEFMYDEDEEEYKGLKIKIDELSLYYDLEENNLTINENKGNLTLIVEEDINIKTANNINIDVEEDATFNIEGDSTFNIDGDSTFDIDGDATFDITGDATIDAMDVSIDANTNINVEGVSINIQSDADLNIDTDGVCNIDGSAIMVAGGGMPIARLGDMVATPMGPGHIVEGSTGGALCG